MPAYGMDIALKGKMAAKRDPNLDREAQEWVEAVIGEKFSNLPYEDALRDGVILCKLMNKLQPGAIPKFATSGGSFKLRENISLFQNAARAYGLGDAELFQTIDLFEKHNIAQVTQCIFALGRNAQKKKFNGPTLGPKMSDANAREFTEEQLRAGQGTLGLLNEGMSKGFEFQSENVSSISKRQPQIEKPSNSNRSVNVESLIASSDLSDCSLSLDNSQRSHKHRSAQQRTLSNSSIANLLTNLQNIKLPASSASALQTNDQQEDNDTNLQVLIDLARDTGSTRTDKFNRLHAFIEESIGMVEFLSLLRYIKSTPQLNINEPPLNLYASILPTLTALLLLENDN